jgi:hypothetical protein
MVLTAANVRVGVSGEIFVAPTGSTAPTTASAQPAAAFIGFGYVSEDGVTETFDRSSDDIKAWQNAATVRSVVTDAAITYQFTLIETTVATVGFANGTTVTQTAAHGTYTIDPSSTGGRKSFIIDVIDGANLKRIYIAEGELTERGDTVYASGEPIGYECTVKAYGSVTVFDTALKTP